MILGTINRSVFVLPEVLKHALTSFIILFSFAARCRTPVKSVKSRLVAKTNAYPKQGI